MLQADNQIDQGKSIHTRLTWKFSPSRNGTRRHQNTTSVNTEAPAAACNASKVQVMQKLTERRRKKEYNVPSILQILLKEQQTTFISNDITQKSRQDPQEPPMSLQFVVKGEKREIRKLFTERTSI